VQNHSELTFSCLLDQSDAEFAGSSPNESRIIEVRMRLRAISSQGPQRHVKRSFQQLQPPCSGAAVSNPAAQPVAAVEPAPEQQLQLDPIPNDDDDVSARGLVANESDDHMIVRSAEHQYAAALQR
jgi:hypothetical protein